MGALPGFKSRERHALAGCDPDAPTREPDFAVRVLQIHQERAALRVKQLQASVADDLSALRGLLMLWSADPATPRAHDAEPIVVLGGLTTHQGGRRF